MNKKILTGILVVVMCFILVGCGKNENNGGASKDNTDQSEYQGNTEGGKDLKGVSTSNYKDVAKTVFGLEIKDVTGWTIKDAKSPNGVNNLNIEYTVSNGEDAKSILEYYFNLCKSLSTDGIYSIGFNESYTAVVKKDKYEDFNTYFTTAGTQIGDFYQVKWIYDNNGKSVQYAMNIEASKADMSFVLLG